jgi:L-rhamnose isomerase / sugar isomerase
MVIREFVDEHNRKALDWLHQDYDHLGKQLRRRGVDIERLTERAVAFRVAVPSWGVGTGGTRFARFAGPASRGTSSRSSTTATSSTRWSG